MSAAEAAQRAIKHLHGCDAVYVETVPVKEVFQGKVVWEGEVEVFDLVDHPKAKRAYAWAFDAGNDETEHVAVLGLGPVDSPQKAVKAYLVQTMSRA